MKFSFVMILAVALLGCGCKTAPPRHFSKSQVIELAQRVGVEHGQDLRFYDVADVFYEVGTRIWYVSFAAKKAYAYDIRWSGGFGVDVEDATGTTKYEEHIWK